MRSVTHQIKPPLIQNLVLSTFFLVPQYFHPFSFFCILFFFFFISFFNGLYTEGIASNIEWYQEISLRLLEREEEKKPKPHKNAPCKTFLTDFL